MQLTLSQILITIACMMPLHLLSGASPEDRGNTLTTSPQLKPTHGTQGKPAFVRVAFTHFPPWSYKDLNGQHRGILVDFFKDLSQEIGVPLKVEDVPIARLHHSQSQGKIDLFVSRAPEKELNCCLSLGKAFESETVIIGRISGPQWDNRSTAEHNICRTGLSGYNISGFRMFDANNLETCIRMVARNRVPFLVGERQSLNKLLQEQPPEIRSLFNSPLVVEKKDLHFFITRHLDQSSLGPEIRKALIQLKLTDYIRRYSDSKP